MINPFPFRALSPHHATEMNLDYLLKVIEAAKKYGFNAIQICGDTHGDGNLDGITEFKKFPKANQTQDQDGVRRRRDILRKTCQAAHENGLEVYFWHHELWYPEGLPDVYPDWFVPAPKNRFANDFYAKKVPLVGPDAPIWDYMDAKFDEAFEQCPELDGTIMTIQESRVPIYCLFEDYEQQVQALLMQYKKLEEAHRRVGKKFIIRTFAWREREYRVVTEAVKRWRPNVPVESKGVPMDWHLWYPYDDLLGKFEGMTNHVEIAPSCEFTGAMRHPVGHPWYYTENLRFAAERGHTGACLRIDRVNVAMLGGPDEGVIACIGKWLNDPAGTDVGVAYVNWLAGRYKLTAEQAKFFLDEIMENCWQATTHSYYNDKIYLGDSLTLRYDNAFYVAERNCCVEYDSPQPMADKDMAVSCSQKAIAALEKLKPDLSAEDYKDLSRRLEFLLIQTKTFRLIVATIIARQKQMYHPSDANKAALLAEIELLRELGKEVDGNYPELRNDERNRIYSQGMWFHGERTIAFADAMQKEVPTLPMRTIPTKLTVAELGKNLTHCGQEAYMPTAAGAKFTLKGAAGAKNYFVMFAATQMCVRRPVIVKSGNWSHTFNVGTYAWFLAHDCFRRYEIAIPDECVAADGTIQIELAIPEPERSPYISQMRIEAELSAK